MSDRWPRRSYANPTRNLNLGASQMTHDWIDNFVASLNNNSTPPLFRHWSAITALSGILGRNVWTTASYGPVYPNIYTVLVGPPAIGKSNALYAVEQLWRRRVSGLHVVPDSITRSGLLVHMTKYSTVAKTIHELDTIIDNLEYLSVLNHLYDTPESFQQELESGLILIPNPSLTILGATQTQLLLNISDEIWDTGFLGRWLFIFTDKVSNGQYNEQPERMKVELPNVLAGELTWSKVATTRMNELHKDHKYLVVSSSKLRPYTARKSIHIIKLAMISAVSRGKGTEVEDKDIDHASNWLREMEEGLSTIL